MERLESAKTETSRFDPYDRFLLAVQSVAPTSSRKAFVAMRDKVTTKREAATAKYCVHEGGGRSGSVGA